MKTPAASFAPALVILAGSLLAGFGLAGCGVEPQFPVSRTGAASPPRVAPQTPPPSSTDEAPAPYRPQPIGSPPAYAPSTGPGDLRGRQSPDAAPAAVRSAPPPALETPSQVVVRPGESLFEVAERVRTPIRAIIDLNSLAPPYEVTPGSILRIPPPVVYTVRSGDTMIGISRRFSIDPRSLANLNDMALETALKPGQRLALPSLVRDKGPNPAASAPALVAAAAPDQSSKSATARPPKAVTAPPLVIAAKPLPLKPEPEPDAPPAPAPAVGKGKFVWPVKGDILSGFGPKGPGQRNDGLNIAANTGDSVRAAAAGQVVYAGNSVPGFGNLVVVKHPDGWTSLYGNLGKMSVKIRSEVAQGQEIGTAGTSGAVDRPQVHFELRYAGSPNEKARPLDPATLLP